jgi:hypothetical protein
LFFCQPLREKGAGFAGFKGGNDSANVPKVDASSAIKNSSIRTEGITETGCN